MQSYLPVIRRVTVEGHVHRDDGRHVERGRRERRRRRLVHHRLLLGRRRGRRQGRRRGHAGHGDGGDGVRLDLHDGSGVLDDVNGLLLLLLLLLRGLEGHRKLGRRLYRRLGRGTLTRIHCQEAVRA